MGGSTNMDELGIDPRTSRMLSERSTTELHAPVVISRRGLQRNDAPKRSQGLTFIDGTIQGCKCLIVRSCSSCTLQGMKNIEVHTPSRSEAKSHICPSTSSTPSPLQPTWSNLLPRLCPSPLQVLHKHKARLSKVACTEHLRWWDSPMLEASRGVSGQLCPITGEGAGLFLPPKMIASTKETIRCGLPGQHFAGKLCGRGRSSQEESRWQIGVPCGKWGLKLHGKSDHLQRFLCVSRESRQVAPPLLVPRSSPGGSKEKIPHCSDTHVQA